MIKNADTFRKLISNVRVNPNKKRRGRMLKKGSEEKIPLEHSDYSTLFIQDMFYLNKITQQLHVI